MNCNVDFLFLFFQDFVCKTLSNEAVWQQKAEDALKRATEDSDSGEWKLRVPNIAIGKSSYNITVRFWSIFLKFRTSKNGRKRVSHLPNNSPVLALILAETSISVEDMCRQLRDQKEECRKLKGK